jgi:hypothetical protein
MPGGYKNIKPSDNTNGLQKNKKNINRKGRPRKLISDTIKKMEQDGIKETTVQEIKSVYLRLINHSKEDLQKVIDDKNQPALNCIVAQNIMSGKGFEVIDKMLDRAIGKATQSMDVTTGGDKINQNNLDKLSTQELKDLLNGEE